MHVNNNYTAHGAAQHNIAITHLVRISKHFRCWSIQFADLHPNQNLNYGMT